MLSFLAICKLLLDAVDPIKFNSFQAHRIDILDDDFADS